MLFNWFMLSAKCSYLLLWLVLKIHDVGWRLLVDTESHQQQQQPYMYETSKNAFGYTIMVRAVSHPSYYDSAILTQIDILLPRMDLLILSKWNIIVAIWVCFAAGLLPSLSLLLFLLSFFSISTIRWGTMWWVHEV